MRVLVALGGNAILSSGAKGTAAEQLSNVDEACRHLVELLKRGHRIAITHGNGPQVGDILLAGEAARDLVEPMPLDVYGAESQGMIGYMLQQSMDDELRLAGIETPVVTILTQTVVSKDDPAFENPTKPIGPFYSKREATALKKKGWKMVNDSGRGFRRVVPSPRPQSIVEAPVIARLFGQGVIVIAAGGGGIPVKVGPDSRLAGLEAVIDKDLGAAVLARVIKAECLLILTDVEKVSLNFGTPRQRPIDVMTVRQARRYIKEGQFAPGSMLPKVEAAVEFVESGGRAVITSLEHASDAVLGKSGTAIVP
jgi:carbamate kinase